ncbi:Serine/threonine-protein phosphatase 6 regulatory ankyrin repeat subunit B [Chionoecetes opilio]|uniref:Serine/threonine-protein phosphatase 6 regulatory ankyrin repeat subunit B n=1 Tax=Chionoecetes opilio TaxID=41210 RepID=A0A8J4XTB7_CHIOP|nr:Serine/threonine-protein phosphatase 6 regulatory ankyrin repeat subunit B [Chionoecetes opilio]
MESQAIGQREGAQAGRSALHTAACMGSLVQVVEMLYRGAQVASPSRLHADNGRQPVHLASYGGHVSLVSVLLGRGADPDASDFQGFRPLHIAAQGGSVEVVELLKDSGANLEAQTKTGLQAIHLAAASGHVHMLKQLQSYQCNLAAPDFSSATPLHHAAQHGKLEAVQWLISAGVSIDTKDEEGKSAVDRAVQYTWHEVARVIAAAITKKTSKKTASSQKRSPQPASPCMVHLEATAKIPRLPPTISQQLTPTTNRNPDEIEESSKLPPTNSPSLPSRPLIPSSMRHSPIHLPITDASKISFSNSLASPPAQPDASITTSFPNTSSTPTHERTTAVKEAKKKVTIYVFVCVSQLCACV